jgi:hypothetical protein
VTTAVDHRFRARPALRSVLAMTHTDPGPVLRVPPAAPDDAAAFFQTRLAFLTDASDVLA